MCDKDQIDDMMDHLRRSGDLTRRRFGAWSLGVGVVSMLPRAADAADVVEAEVEVKTPDGVADCHFAHPTTGAHPGVLVWPDAMGLRPAFKQMGRRLAESGYSVLTVNQYYRSMKAPVAPPGANMQSEAMRAVMEKTRGTLSPTTHVTDAKAFLAWLDEQKSVDRRRKVGTTGYCMGGPITMRTAATLPDRVGAGASFHGGGLVSDQPDSPHLLVPKMKVQYLIAIAANDDMRDPAAKDKLKEAFANAKLPAEIEVYAGAQHGWCPPDSAVYNEAQAEKAWARMLALFKKALA